MNILKTLLLLTISPVTWYLHWVVLARSLSPAQALGPSWQPGHGPATIRGHPRSSTHRPGLLACHEE